MKKIVNKIKSLKKSQKIALSIIILLVLLLIVSGITYAVILNTSTDEVVEEAVEIEDTYEPELTVFYEVDESTNKVIATITSTDSISKMELKTLSTSEEEDISEESTDVEVIYQAETEEETKEVEYTYTLDETWVASVEATEEVSDETSDTEEDEITEEVLTLVKEYTENCNETYLLTFENEEFDPQEIEVEITSFEEVTLEVDTAGLEEGTEVTILTYEDGTIEVITTDDPDYDTKVSQATSVSSGTITSSGVTLNTVNSTLINLSTLSTEEQALSITVTNIIESTDENTSEESTEDNSSTSSTSSSTSGTTSSGSTSASSGSTSSGSSSNGSTSSSSSSSSTDTSSSSTTTYYYYSLVSGVNTELCNLINSERSSLGVDTLSISSTLVSAAEDWAYTMAVNGGISHNYYSSLNGREIVLATVTSSASTAWSNIQNSSDHYSIAISTFGSPSEIGAACVYDGVGGYYWCVYIR